MTTTQLALMTRAKMTIAQTKASLPQDMGEGVMLTDALFFEPQLTLQFSFTIPNMYEIDDPEEKEDAIEFQKGMICMGLCSDSSSIELLDNGFIFKYMYFDTSGNMSHVIEITKDVFMSTLQEINEEMEDE